MTTIDDTVDLTQLHSDQRDAWYDAYHIAWVGACNPIAVDRAIERHTGTVGVDFPAVQAMRGHQDFLRGFGLGPSFELLDQVKANAERFGWL